MSIFGDIVSGVAGGAASATPTGAVSEASKLGGKVVDLVDGVINRIWPDPIEAEKARLALRQMEQAGELQTMAIEAGLLQGQLDVNKAEAAAGGWFVPGWRPAIGWVGAIALFFYYVPRCVVTVFVWLIACYHAGAIVEYPAMDISDLLGIIGTMLGMSGLRSLDKRGGMAS